MVSMAAPIQIPDPQIGRPRETSIALTVIAFDGVWVITCALVFGLLLLGVSGSSTTTTWPGVALIAVVFVGCLLVRHFSVKGTTSRLVAGISIGIGVVSATVLLLVGQNLAMDIRFGAVESEATATAERLLDEPAAWPEGQRCHPASAGLAPLDDFVDVVEVCRDRGTDGPFLFVSGPEPDYRTLVYAPNFDPDTADYGLQRLGLGWCVRQITDHWWTLNEDTDGVGGCALGFTFTPSGP